MEVNHPVGVIAVALGILTFFGSIYLVVALNVGWRFGYWLASACFGGLMIFVSIFWALTGLGPAGETAHWIPRAAGENEVGQVSFGGTTYDAPPQYPEGPWQPVGEAPGIAPEQPEALGSALQNCLTADPESLGAEEQEICSAAQELLPADEELPKVRAQTVAMQPKFTQTEFTVEGGTKLAQTVVVPITRDPRIADDPQEGEPVGEPFRMVASFDPGSLRLPGTMSFVVFGLYTGFHLWGLNRAERRKLSPVAQ